MPILQSPKWNNHQWSQNCSKDRNFAGPNRRNKQHKTHKKQRLRIQNKQGSPHPDQTPRLFTAPPRPVPHRILGHRLLRSLASLAISSYADTEPELRERNNEEADGQGQERERKKCRDMERRNCSGPLGQERHKGFPGETLT
jgi:hypothetical protein